METTTYLVDDFVRDILATMEHEGAKAQRLTREALERACASPALMQGHEERMAAVSEYEILKTPRAAIKIFILKPRKGSGGPPHDHAGLWGAYAAHTNAYWMETFREADPSGERVEAVERRLMPQGEIRFMGEKAIHRVFSEEPCLLLTVYNGDLNALPRRIWDTETGRVIRARSRWEERVGADGKVNFDLPD
jgi:hypothetical protein